jgi:hypothetical protein
MRSAKFAFALLGFAALLMAADPFAGAWSLNTAKTKYKTGTPAKEQTLTITETGSDLDSVETAAPEACCKRATDCRKARRRASR